jgi:hypothetical protein
MFKFQINVDRHNPRLMLNLLSPYRPPNFSLLALDVFFHGFSGKGGWGGGAVSVWGIKEGGRWGWNQNAGTDGGGGARTTTNVEETVVKLCF